MATLKTNGTVLIEMIAAKSFTGDDPLKEKKITRRVMSSGFMLIKIDRKCDFGHGLESFPGTWKRGGKVKINLLNDKPALTKAMQNWTDQLIQKGWDAEIS